MPDFTIQNKNQPTITTINIKYNDKSQPHNANAGKFAIRHMQMQAQLCLSLCKTNIPPTFFVPFQVFFFKEEQFPITGCLLLGSKWGILHFWRSSLITSEWKKWETQGQRALMKFHYRHQLTDLVMKYEAGQNVDYGVLKGEINWLRDECLPNMSVSLVKENFLHMLQMLNTIGSFAKFILFKLNPGAFSPSPFTCQCRPK